MIICCWTYLILLLHDIPIISYQFSSYFRMGSFSIVFLLGVQMALNLVGSSIYIFIRCKIGSQMHARNNFLECIRSPENY